MEGIEVQEIRGSTPKQVKVHSAGNTAYASVLGGLPKGMGERWFGSTVACHPKRVTLKLGSGEEESTAAVFIGIDNGTDTVVTLDGAKPTKYGIGIGKATGNRFHIKDRYKVACVKAGGTDEVIGLQAGGGGGRIEMIGPEKDTCGTGSLLVALIVRIVIVYALGSLGKDKVNFAGFGLSVGAGIKAACGIGMES